MKYMKTELIKVKDIVADKDQPRKFFNELRMKDLANSVKKYGIKVPIEVEDYGNGKYLLVDGERRYRVALQLNMEEIPAIIIAPQKATDRLVEQFHLQEQHEGWNSMEKANAINRLAKELKIGLPEMVELLSLPRGTVGMYMAVSSLVDREKFEASNVPVDWIPAVVVLKNRAKKIWQDTTKTTFIRSQEKQLEGSVLKAIKADQIQNKHGFSKLGDVFETNPKLIQKFLDGELNVETAYLESDALGTHAIRSTVYSARFIIKSIKTILESKNAKLRPEDTKTYLALKKSVDSLVKFIGE
jgi:ParB/RepB/Spo0J family partition protein